MMFHRGVDKPVLMLLYVDVVLSSSDLQFHSEQRLFLELTKHRHGCSLFCQLHHENTSIVSTTAQMIKSSLCNGPGSCGG